MIASNICSDRVEMCGGELGRHWRLAQEAIKTLLTLTTRGRPSTASTGSTGFAVAGTAAAGAPPAEEGRSAPPPPCSTSPMASAPPLSPSALAGLGLASLATTFRSGRSSSYNCKVCNREMQKTIFKRR